MGPLEGIRIIEMAGIGPGPFAAMLLALHWVGKGEWQWAVAFYVLASIGYFWGNVFGDSMLVAVAEPGKLDITSAIGYFAGYLGGVHRGWSRWALDRAARCGLSDGDGHVRAVGSSTGP